MMNAIHDSRAVQAQVQYADCAPGASIEYRLNDWSGFETRAVTVPIHDADTFTQPPTLDREGFTLAPLECELSNYEDRAQVDQVWRPAVHALLQRLTGASHVITWAVNLRYAAENARPSSIVSAPARRVHSDFSPSDFVHEIRHPLAKEELEKVMGKARPPRWKCFNVWQPLSMPPHDAPLALCDARSISSEDVIPARGHLMAQGRSTFAIDLCLFRYNAKHRWCYFRNLAPGQALIFCGLDPWAQRPHSVVPHTAFDDPSCPAGGVPRSSIEIRALAVFDQ